MQDPANELPRILIPRTPVNKGEKKRRDRASYFPAPCDMPIDPYLQIKQRFHVVRSM